MPHQYTSTGAYHSPQATGPSGAAQAHSLTQFRTAELAKETLTTGLPSVEGADQDASGHLEGEDLATGDPASLEPA